MQPGCGHRRSDASEVQMLIACWSSKGGAGTTVVASALALVLGQASDTGARLADLAGDAPAVLGMPELDGPGLADWLAAGVDVPLDALSRLELPIAPGVALLPRGAGALADDRAEVLAALLSADPRTTVADCGSDPSGAARAIASGAARSLLVTRACFVALRRAMAAPIRPTHVVLVSEPGRSLTRHDVEECLGCAVVAEVDVDPAVARAVDAGLLAARLPRGLARELRRVV
jgi:MinD-like ATPase involved in chromosome partitioning or flagellar assembly